MLRLAGLAVFEGDIVLGTVAAHRGRFQKARSNEASRRKESPSKAANIAGPRGRSRIGSTPTFQKPEHVTKAIEHWEANTKIRFIALTSEDLNQFQDRVIFIPRGTVVTHTLAGKATNRK